jgi:hypothetical protein
VDSACACEAEGGPQAPQSARWVQAGVQRARTQPGVLHSCTHTEGSGCEAEWHAPAAQTSSRCTSLHHCDAHAAVEKGARERHMGAIAQQHTRAPMMQGCRRSRAPARTCQTASRRRGWWAPGVRPPAASALA